MSDSLDRLKALNKKLEKKIGSKQNLFDDSFLQTNSISTDKAQKTQVETTNKKESALKFSDDRQDNMQRIQTLFQELDIAQKCQSFDDVFLFKAMNLAGIGLRDDDFGEVRAGKYIQIIAISYDTFGGDVKKAKNISLGYYGKGENLDVEKKHKIIEFILRWR